MKLVVLSTVYPSNYNPVGATPVVHYFAREWVKMGHEVTVFHVQEKYPFFYYLIAKLFSKQLATKLGHPIASVKPYCYSEIVDGVIINHIPPKRFSPYSKISEKELNSILSQIEKYCNENGVPDMFLGHWDCPQLELLFHLKSKYPNVRTSIVFHALKKDLFKIYGKERLSQIINSIDYVGFRNPSAKDNFEKKYFKLDKTFIAYSGVSNAFLNVCDVKSFQMPIQKFIFVGMLIERKHPLEILESLISSYGDKKFKITYVGEGREKKTIQSYWESTNKIGELVFTGRIDREAIVSHLKQSEVFVMISENETFGLVYLEAMSQRCITIASRKGGVDGIIRHGYNGFLCEQGNIKELTSLISYIRELPTEELNRISLNARNTAREYSDYAVAKKYIDNFTAD